MTGQIAILGRIIAVLLGTIAVLGVIGFVQSLRAKKKAAAADACADKDELIPSENVGDLNDRFNRARYMDQDGK